MKFIIELTQEEIRDTIDDGSLLGLLEGLKGVAAPEARLSQREAEAVSEMPSPYEQAAPLPSVPVSASTTAVPAVETAPQASIAGAAPQAPIAEAAPQAPIAPVATTTIGYTIDELAAAAMSLMDKGMQADLQNLLAAFGVQSLPELTKEKYGEFATRLREMGAQI